MGFLGWCMTISSIWLIPAYAVYLYLHTEGTHSERMAKISSPREQLPKVVNTESSRINIKDGVEVRLEFKGKASGTDL